MHQLPAQIINIIIQKVDSWEDGAGHGRGLTGYRRLYLSTAFKGSQLDAFSP